MLKLLIATTNKGKVKEFAELLKNLPVELKTLEDYEKIPKPLETGSTFKENAELKAIYYAERFGVFALADDSGLCVDSLNGEPGVFSARYAGENANDSDNIQKLLKSLKETENANRTARFICEMAIADSSGKIKFNSSGNCEGKIAFEPHGNNGFGYDPIFIPKDRSETFGQLSHLEKKQISHRSKASGKIIKSLKKYLAP